MGSSYCDRGVLKVFQSSSGKDKLDVDENIGVQERILPLDKQGREPVEVEDEVHLLSCWVLNDCCHAQHLLRLLQEEDVW